MLRAVSPSKAFTLLELVVVVAVLVALTSMAVLSLGRTEEGAQLTVAKASLQTVREAFTGSPSAPGLLADVQSSPQFDPDILRLADLFTKASNLPPFNFTTGLGWHGPYLQETAGPRTLDPAGQGRFPRATDRRLAGDATFLERHFYSDSTHSAYGTAGEPAQADPWGNPIVLQVPPASAFNHPSTTQRLQFARLVSAGPDGVLDTPADRLAGRTSDGAAVARGDDLVLFLNRADVYETDGN